MLTFEPDCSSHTPHNARTYAHHTAPTLAPYHTLGAHTHTHNTPAPYNDGTQELTSTHSHTHTNTTPHSQTAVTSHASPHLHTHLHPHSGAMHTHALPDTSIAPPRFHTTPTHTFTECHRVHEWAIAGNTFRPRSHLGQKPLEIGGGFYFSPLERKRRRRRSEPVSPVGGSLPVLLSPPTHPPSLSSQVHSSTNNQPHTHTCARTHTRSQTDLPATQSREVHPP